MLYKKTPEKMRIFITNINFMRQKKKKVSKIFIFIYHVKVWNDDGFIVFVGFSRT